MAYYKIYHGIVYLGAVCAGCKYEAKQKAIATFSYKVKDFNNKFLNTVKIK
jgi:hypothetical protein